MKSNVGVMGWLSLLLAISIFPLWACTGVMVQGQNGTVVTGRTMEFGIDLMSDIIMIPRGHITKAILPDGKPGMVWTQRYAAVGFNAWQIPVIEEGVNEKGLQFGAFLFPGYASYQPLTPGNASRAMTAVYVGTWILGNFATVDEVKAHMRDAVVINGNPYNVQFPLPLHFRVIDATGKAIVIEYTDGGKMVIYDNPIGVVTNAPTFGWHMTNLGNYANLSPINANGYTVNGVQIQSLGQGSGMLGLPGDSTPPSRFVRMVAVQAASLPVKTSEEAVNLGWTLMNSIAIPKGAIREVKPNGAEPSDYTQWTAVTDLANRKLYFRNYDNQEIRVVDLMQMPLDSPTILKTPVSTKPEYHDLTAQMKSKR